MLLPCIYIKRDDDIKKSFNGKIKLSVRVLFKSFGQGSGLIMHVAELIGKKNWKSAWLLLLPDRNSWYTVQRIYWRKVLEKSKKSPPILNARSNQHDGFWLKNEHFYKKHKNILLSSDAWLNYRTMAAAQILIFRTLGTQAYYQSLLDCQKRIEPYKAVNMYNCFVKAIISGS